MLHSRQLPRALLTFLVIAMVLLPPWASRAGSQPLVVVIVGQGAPIKNVSRAELRRLFLRDTDSIDGERMVPFNYPPGTATRLQFDRAVLGMSEAEVGRYWIDRRVRGESGAPRTVAPPELLRRVVSRFPGAIAYLHANEVDASVQVVSVDGKAPNDPNYPLK